MKKSSIKYFGVTAAALLAVSPVASTVFSQANSVSAASTMDQGHKDAASRAISSMNSGVNLNSADSQSVVAALSNTYNGYSELSSTTSTGNIFVKNVLPSYFSTTVNGQNQDDSNVKYSFRANGMSTQELQQRISNAQRDGQTYSANITAVATDKSDPANPVELSTKNITVNFSKSLATNLNATFADTAANVGQSSDSFDYASEAMKSLKLTDPSGADVSNNIVSGSARASIVPGSGSNVFSKNNGQFNQAGKAVQTLTFDVNVTTDYKAPKIMFNDKELTESADPVSRVSKNAGTQLTKGDKVTVTLKRTVNVYDGSNSFQPFFAVKNGTYFASVANNANATLTSDKTTVVDGAINAGTSATTQSVADKFNANVQFNYAPDAKATATATDIKNSVVNAGGSVDNNGNISGLNGINYLTVTLYSQINNKPASINVPVNFSATASNTKNAPQFTGVDNSVVIQGQPFNVYQNVKAYENGYDNAPEIMSGYWTVQNPVNTNVAGDYTVVYTAVNSQGATTTINRKVTVLPVNGQGKDQVVNFVPGYGVMVWSATDNAVNATSDFVQHGTTVKTFDTKTVDGVSYTRINKSNSNQWVQSKYFDANANNAPQTNNNDNNTNTDSNKETPFESTLTINYVPGYRVFLRDGQANMQQQSVAHGESFKVWAKKTVGNHTYYRIGTDAQWIEDTYAQF